MKLIFAIVAGEDSSRVAVALARAGFYFTKLATSGGFLSSGNTTFLIGISADKVNAVIETISSHCKQRKRMLSTSSHDMADSMGQSVEITIGGATVFVVDVERFEKL